jgi:hypothetical protein
VAENEAEGDGIAEGEAVCSVVVLGRIVTSEVVSNFAGSCAPAARTGRLAPRGAQKPWTTPFRPPPRALP